MVLQGIKDILHSLPSEIKDSVSLNTAREGDGNWAVHKDILVWILDSEKGTFQLPYLLIKELKALLAISPSQMRIEVPSSAHLLVIGGSLRLDTYPNPA